MLVIRLLLLVLLSSSIFGSASYAAPATQSSGVEGLLAKHFATSISLARVDDVFPLELSAEEKKMAKAQQLELRSYYAYARNELAKICRGQVLAPIRQDLDLDGKRDYAAILIDKSNQALKFAIFNDTKILYQADFPHHYTELMNQGTYPLNVIVGRDMKKVSAPCIRLISIAGPHEFLFFDKMKKDWVRMRADDRH